jgi:hypothetical protein
MCEIPGAKDSSKIDYIKLPLFNQKASVLLLHYVPLHLCGVFIC